MTVPDTYRPVLLEKYVFPSVAESVGALLGIEVAFVPRSIVGAVWRADAFPPESTWAVARLGVHLPEGELSAFLVQPLEAALEWGAFGLRKPAGGAGQPGVSPNGEVILDDGLQQDFQAYCEVCNVVACSVLARAWRARMDRPLHITLGEVIATAASRFPADPEGLLVLQATFAYSEPLRHGRPQTGPGKMGADKGASQLSLHTPLLLALPIQLAAAVSWGSSDGTEEKKTQWLATTGQWRWAKSSPAGPGASRR